MRTHLAIVRCIIHGAWLAAELTCRQNGMLSKWSSSAVCCAPCELSWLASSSYKLACQHHISSLPTDWLSGNWLLSTSYSNMSKVLTLRLCLFAHHQYLWLTAVNRSAQYTQQHDDYQVQASRKTTRLHDINKQTVSDVCTIHTQLMKTHTQPY